MRDLLDALEGSRKVVLTTHITPDGDGLGSALALLRYLRRNGKSAQVINCSVPPGDLRWLYGKGELSIFNGATEAKALAEADLLIATDLGGAQRLGTMLDPFRKAAGRKALIDHHLYEDDLFQLRCVDTGASSSAEIVYRILTALDAEITADLAVPLYVGLMTDTGSFSYGSTSPASHRMAAALVEAGVQPQEIWFRMACQIPLGKMRCLGLLLARLSTEMDGRLVSASADRDFLARNDTLPRDAFEVVNYFLRVKGVEAGAFFLEVARDLTKVSLRSAGRVDVGRLAAARGGGGHRHASGLTVPLPLQDAQQSILAELRRELDPGRMQPLP